MKTNRFINLSKKFGCFIFVVIILCSIAWGIIFWGSSKVTTSSIPKTDPSLWLRKIPVSLRRSVCDIQQGKWISSSIPEFSGCYIIRPTTDAGKLCQDHQDCEGNCLAFAKAFENNVSPRDVTPNPSQLHPLDPAAPIGTDFGYCSDTDAPLKGCIGEVRRGYTMQSCYH